MSRSRLSTLSIGVLLICCACRAPIREYPCARPEFDPPADPAVVWKCNRDVLDRVARDRPFTLREYREAAAFMERLTGVSANSLEAELGPLPNRNLDDRLREWDAWFVVNRGRLRWDADHRRIVVAPSDGE